MNLAVILIFIVRLFIICHAKNLRRTQGQARGSTIRAYYPTDDEIKGILSEVNMLRNNVEQNVPNMRCLSYNHELASEAYASAKKCDGYQDPPTYGVAGYDKLAMNVMVTRQSGKPDYQNVIDAWYLQSADFDHSTGQCDNGPGAFCDYYLNMMFADASHIGCAMAKCDDIEAIGGGSAYVVVCYFGAAYNKTAFGGKPFPSGDTAQACSSCPAEKPTCSSTYKRLCCDQVTTTTSTTTSTTTTTATTTTTTTSATTTSTSTSTKPTTQVTKAPVHPMEISVQRCIDDNKYNCNAKSCQRQPGIYLYKCPVTCGNCNGDKCYDSTSFNCAFYRSKGFCEREVDAMKKFCPKTCNFCAILASARPR